MAFPRKSGIGYPASIRDLNFDNLHNSQMWVLADWMGCRTAVGRATGGENDKRAVLRQNCERDWDRAQQGYEIIVLNKAPPANAGGVAGDELAKRLYSTVNDLLNSRRDDIEAGVARQLQELLKRTTESLEKLAPALAKKAIEEAADRKAPIVIKDGDKIRKVKGTLPAEFQRMVELASARIPILLVGPAGCGKTYLCEKLAEALDMDFSDQSCSEGMSESVFNGLLLPIGKGGEFKHVPSPYMERYEKGGVMLLDEIDAGDANLFTYINKSIANTSYTVAQRWTNPVVKKSKDFVLAAAANTFGTGSDAMYVGRNQLDAATLDRFKIGMITMDYSKEVESELGTPELCEWAWKVRAAIRAHGVRRIMSTRVIKDLGEMTRRYGWKKDSWERAYFAGWSEDDYQMVAKEV